MSKRKKEHKETKKKNQNVADSARFEKKGVRITSFIGNKGLVALFLFLFSSILAKKFTASLPVRTGVFLIGFAIVVNLNNNRFFCTFIANSGSFLIPQYFLNLPQR